jgi:DNA-directed RNA polymerase subunit alpha
MIETATPRIETLDQSDIYGKFVVEPLERGYGVTLGNSLRRVLLSSIPGAAVTSIKIEGVLHEFQTIDGVKEDTTEVILNLKDLFVRVHPDGGSLGPKTESRVITIDAQGPGTVTGADIHTPADVEIVNPEVYLATLSTETAKRRMELIVEEGKGYVLPDKQDKTKHVIGVIPIGAAFTPVRRVSFNVESTRVGFKTDFERLTLEIWTNGTMSPADALSEAAYLLEQFFHRFVEFPKGARGRGGLSGLGTYADGANVAFDEPIERMDFSVRTFNCLKKHNVLTIGDLLQISEADLMQIRNFGKKSLTEVKEKLGAMGLSILGATDDDTAYGDDDEEAAGTEDDAESEPLATAAAEG